MTTEVTAPEHHAANVPRPESGSDDFRSSLLFVLAIDLMALFAWLAWSRRSTPAVALALGALAVPIAIVLGTRPALRRVVSLLVKRERDRLQIVAPIAASVTFFAIAFHLGAGVDGLAAASAARHLGPIDEVVVSPNADARNEALDALSRSRDNDARIRSAVDDLLPLVVVEGTLQVEDRRFAVTVLELDVPVAQTFGGNASETGLTGMAPLGFGEVALDRALTGRADGVSASRLSIGGVARDVRLVPIVARKGFTSFDLSGVADPSFGRSPDRAVVFVAPGTISTAIDALPDRGASANAQFLVAVSNGGDATSGLRRSAANMVLLEETLANPPAGPVALPADDPLGLGGAMLSVAAPIEASVVAVKAAHFERLRIELESTQRVRRLARAALFGAAIACAALSFVTRRRRTKTAHGVLSSLGASSRSSLAVEGTYLGIMVLVGLVVGMVLMASVGAVIGTLGPIDPALANDRSVTAKALTLAGAFGLAPVLIRMVWQLVPSRLRRIAARVPRTQLPRWLLALAGLLMGVLGVVALWGRSEEWSVGVGLGLVVAGAAVVAGVTILRRPPFGRPNPTRHASRLRSRAFAGVAAVTGLIVLPVAASQSLVGSAAAIVSSPWKSVVTIHDEADAAGLAGQLVRSVGGRVFHRSTLLVEGDRADSPATPSVALAAADGLGDRWIPSPAMVSGASTSDDLPAGSIVVSERLAAVRGGVKPGDRMVLSDSLTNRSITVTVHDTGAFPSWAGDLALPADVYSGLLTSARVGVARDAIAVSPHVRASVDPAMRSLAPNAAATVTDIDARPSNISDNLVRWLRRVALVAVGMAIALALVLGTGRWRSMHWSVVVAASGFGWLVAMAVGGPPSISAIGPLLVATALAMLCCLSALRLFVPDLRASEVVRHIPRRTRKTGEFD